MGFSLEGLFINLERCISSADKDDSEKLIALINSVEWWKNYAIQCGKMKDT